MSFEIRGIWILVFAAFIGAAIVIFFKKCGSKPEIVLTVNTDSLNMANKITKKVSDSLQAVLNDSIRYYKTREISANIVLQITQQKLQTQFKLAEVYRKQLDYYAVLPPDSGMISVHPEYIGSCDSLADLSVRLEDNFNAYKQESNTVQDYLRQQIALKDREITAHLKGKQELEGQNAWLTKGINEIAKKGQPRNKMFFGAAIAGTQINPLFGFGLGVGFMNKKEQLISTDALMIRGGELMFQISGKFKISFR